MEKLEVLLKQDLSAQFDTPKKINRSDARVPQTVIDEIESGAFTSESIEALVRSKIPVFKYRTCITIHGNFPAVETTSIGGYKNIHQNGNGSLEVYYSAIDTEKIERVRELIAGTGAGWHFYSNSSARGFQIAKQITKETLQQVRNELQPIAERVTRANIYGHTCLYIGRDMFRTFLCLDVNILAIPADQVNTFAQTLHGLEPDQYAERRAKYLTEQAAEEKRRAEQDAAWTAEYHRLKAEYTKLMQTEFAPKIAGFKDCSDLNAGTLVRIGTTADNKPYFLFYRVTGKGSFGRVTWQRAKSLELNLDALEWQDQKQQKLSEINTKNFKLVPAMVPA